MAINGDNADFQFNIKNSNFTNCETGLSVYDINSTHQSGGGIFHVIGRNVNFDI